jgi:hypothetical protein
MSNEYRRADYAAAERIYQYVYVAAGCCWLQYNIVVHMAMPVGYGRSASPSQQSAQSTPGRPPSSLQEPAMVGRQQPQAQQQLASSSAPLLALGREEAIFDAHKATY